MMAFGVRESVFFNNAAPSRLTIFSTHEYVCSTLKSTERIQSWEGLKRFRGDLGGVRGRSGGGDMSKMHCMKLSNN